MLETANKGLFCQLITIPLFKEHKILCQVAGHASHTIKLLPAFVINDKDCDWIVRAFDEVIAGSHRVPGAVWSLGKTLISQRHARAASPLIAGAGVAGHVCEQLAALAVPPISAQGTSAFCLELSGNADAGLAFSCHAINMRGNAMTRTLTTLAAAATLAVAAIAAPAPAQARGGAIAAGVIGGLAAGAIIGGAAAASVRVRLWRYGYGGLLCERPVLCGRPPCGWRRERFWDGYGWRVRRVRVCY